MFVRSQIDCENGNAADPFNLVVHGASITQKQGGMRSRLAESRCFQSKMRALSAKQVSAVCTKISA
jgi:hypothetical protein